MICRKLPTHHGGEMEWMDGGDFGDEEANHRFNGEKHNKRGNNEDIGRGFINSSTYRHVQKFIHGMRSRSAWYPM